MKHLWLSDEGEEVERWMAKFFPLFEDIILQMKDAAITQEVLFLIKLMCSVFYYSNIERIQNYLHNVEKFRAWL